MSRLQMEARLAGEGQPPTPGLVGPCCQCWPSLGTLGSPCHAALSFTWDSCVGGARKISGSFSWRWSPLIEEVSGVTTKETYVLAPFLSQRHQPYLAHLQ